MARCAVRVEDGESWLVAAGRREEGSPEDFYQALAASARAARGRYNASHRPPLATDTHTGHLLPTRDDRDRHAAEGDSRLLREIEATVRRLTRASLLSGRECQAALAAARLGVLVRAMLHTREAWGYAKQGRLGAFRRATGRAEDVMSENNSAHDPYWIAYFDEAELAGVTGGRMLEIARRVPGNAEEAASYIERAVQLRSPHRLRSAALDRIGLAEARLLQGHNEEAARLGHAAADVAERTPSDRVRIKLAKLYRATDSARDTSCVAELRNRLRSNLSSVSA